MFVPFSKNKFLAIASVRYGVIVVEGRPNAPVNSICKAQVLLKKMVQDHHLQVYEASDDISQMRLHGVCESMAEVYERLVELDMPLDFTPEFEFKLHPCLGNPLPHGHILSLSENQNITNEVISYVDDGFLFLVEAEHVDPYQRLYILKAMIEAKVPHDLVEWRGLIQRLPPEIQRLHEQVHAPFFSDNPES